MRLLSRTIQANTDKTFLKNHLPRLRGMSWENLVTLIWLTQKIMTNAIDSISRDRPTERCSMYNEATNDGPATVTLYSRQPTDTSMSTYSNRILVLWLLKAWMGSLLQLLQWRRICPVLPWTVPNATHAPRPLYQSITVHQSFVALWAPEGLKHCRVDRKYRKDFRNTLGGRRRPNNTGTNVACSISPACLSCIIRPYRQLACSARCPDVAWSVCPVSYTHLTLPTNREV